MMKIGRPNYSNCDPIYFPFEENLLPLPTHAKLVYGTPAELNEKMRKGELDVGPISSIEYARHPHQYYLLPFPCLSGNGEIKSITLFSTQPIESLKGETLAVTRSSATSSALLKILMEYYLTQEVKLVPMEPYLTKMLEEYPAALLIGDEALHAPKEASTFSYDLGKLWKEYTHSPMVYAVWAVQKKFAKEQFAVLQIFSETLRGTLELSQAEEGKLLTWSSEKHGFRPDFLQKYFSSLKFTFDPAERNSLLLFYDYASSLGLCPDCTVLKFWENGKTTDYIGDLKKEISTSALQN